MASNSQYSPAPAGAGTVLDAETLVLCDSTGARFIRTIEYNTTTGAVSSVTNTALDGVTPFTPTGSVTNCNAALPAVSADHFEVLPGTPYTPAVLPAGRRLVGIAYSVLSGTATVVDAIGATSIAALPTGYSAEWSVSDDQETLTGPASITAAAASRVVVTFTTATP